MSRPIYLRVENRAGAISIEQVEYLTAQELAALCKVEVRTIYLWIEKRMIAYHQPEGTGQKLFALADALDWIERGRVQAE